MVLICISPMTNNVEHLSMYLLNIYIPSLKKCLFKSFAHFFLKFFFLMWTIFKVFIELLQYCFCFICYFWLWGMWDLSSQTRDWTCNPCIGRSLNHWTTREVLDGMFLFSSDKYPEVELLDHMVVAFLIF